jgi:hypothetical protein
VVNLLNSFNLIDGQAGDEKRRLEEENRCHADGAVKTKRSQRRKSLEQVASFKEEVVCFEII